MIKIRYHASFTIRRTKTDAYGVFMRILGPATNVVPLTAKVVQDLCGEAGKVRGHIVSCSDSMDGPRHPALPPLVFILEPRPKSGEYYCSAFWHTELEKRIQMIGVPGMVSEAPVELSVVDDDHFQVRYLKEFVSIETADYAEAQPCEFPFMWHGVFTLTMTRSELYPEFVERALQIGVGARFWRNGDYPHGESSERYRFKLVFELAPGIVVANDDVAGWNFAGYTVPGQSVCALIDARTHVLLGATDALIRAGDVLELPIPDLKWNSDDIQFRPIIELLNLCVRRCDSSKPPVLSEPLQIVWERYSHLQPKN